MNQEHLNAVREAVIKANPTDDRWNVILADEEKVRLADVLLALGDKMPGMQMQLGGFLIEAMSEKPLWNLRQDDISLQSEETIEFLYELLKP